ncbi:Breast carcinoma amplified sequence 2 [Moelleriella libera RCEF 2490]|uniref:Breast carcinoma amplified sequence 2 n=1 Tax=Moelleriella libera RCEF 2490 TaxID=1081109 RepID=A0A167YAU3_9HYPO|nr:Breast carcinoma amplified sequence 2 [Moelleriella libera RCEF 2490]
MSVPAYHDSLPCACAPPFKSLSLSLGLSHIEPAPSVPALEAAKALIAAELSHHPPPSPSSSKSASSANPYAHLTSPSPLDTTRYEAQDPSSSRASPNDVEPPLRRAYTSAAYLASRVQNLQLLDAYGANAWLLSNHHLENQLRALERELAQTRRDMDEVNIKRARRQELVKAELHALEDTWKKGVGRVLETEVAVHEIQAQIRDELRKRSSVHK